MITLTIEGREYTAPQDWSELTLQQFIDICEINVPKKLSALYEASAALSEPEPEKLKAAEDRYDLVSEEIREYDLIRKFPVYYGRVMKILTNVPEATIKRIHHEPRTAFFDQYVRYIVLSSFYSTPIILNGEVMEAYEPPKMESFEHKGKKYLMPQSLNLLGEEIPLAKERAVTFAEAADIELAWSDLQEDGSKQLPLFCAIYCREKAEEYDEEAILSRAEMFRSLPMSIVWAVFFCISKLSRKYTRSTHDFLNGAKRLSREVSLKAG